MSLQRLILQRRTFCAFFGTLFTGIAATFLGGAEVLVMVPAAVVLVTLLGILRCVINSVNHFNAQRQWRILQNQSIEFKMPLRAPKTAAGRQRLYRAIPFNPDLRLWLRALEENGSFSFTVRDESHEEIFGRLAGAVLAAWGRIRLPNLTVYRIFSQWEGCECLFARAQLVESRSVSAYVIAAMKVSRIGGLVTVRCGSKVFFKYIRGVKPVNKLWYRGDYVTAAKHYVQPGEVFLRMLPVVSMFYLPALITPGFSSTQQGLAKELLQLSGKFGESGDDALLDVAREAGILRMTPYATPQLIEVKNALLGEMTRALNEETDAASRRR